MDRWKVAGAAIVVLIGPGSLYAFSLVSPALMAAYNWSADTVAFAFGIANFFLAIGALAGGLLVDRFGSRLVAIIGSVVWGLANILVGFLVPPLGVPGLYIAFGVLGGLGCGCATIAALSAVMKRFPENRGFGGGLVIMGFGLGAFVFNTVISTFMDFGTVSAAAEKFMRARASAAFAFDKLYDPAPNMMSPQLDGDLMRMFIVAGIIWMVVGGAASYMLGADPEHVDAEGPEATPLQMLATPQFYILWATLFLNVVAGVVIVSNAPAIMQELAPEDSAGAIGGSYLFLSLFNGVGPLLWGAISDRIGRRSAFAGIFGLQVLAFFLLALVHAYAVIIVGVALVLLCYGGGFGTMPAYIADHFGTKHFGVNYALNLTAWGFAGLAGPSLVQFVRGVTGTYAGTLEPSAILLSVAIIFPIISESVRTRHPAATAAPATS